MSASSLLSVVGALGCLMLAVFAPITIVANRRRRRRYDQLLTWAAANGWAVTPHPHVDWTNRLPGNNPRGVSVMLSAVVDGWTVNVAEYSVTDTQVSATPDAMGGTTSTTTTSTSYYVVTVVRLDRELPSTSVARRGAIGRLAHTVLGPDDTVTGHRDFDRAFRIRTTDPAAVRRWFTPPLLAEQLAGRVPTWSVHGTDLLCYASGHLRPDQIQAYLQPALYLATVLTR